MFFVLQNKDNYGNEVTQLARPLPVEYLLVDLPAAFPVEPQYTFQTNNGLKPFPVENRANIGECQVEITFEIPPYSDCDSHIVYNVMHF